MSTKIDEKQYDVIILDLYKMSEMSHICSICQRQFSRSANLSRHLDTVHSEEREKANRHECPICHRTFARKSANVFRHIQTVHEKHGSLPSTASVEVLSSKVEHLVDYLKERDEALIQELQQTKQEIQQSKQEADARDETLKQEIQQSKKEVTELKQEIQQIKPANNVLQVVCIGSNDNYLQMLTESMGDVVPAIEYIKQCALFEVKGDSSLLDKVYQVTFEKPLLVSYDKKKGTVTYYNEHKQLVTESHGSFAQKIANNLQNCYLKGMTHITTTSLEHKVNPNKLLDTYDFRVWNEHIYQLF